MFEAASTRTFYFHPVAAGLPHSAVELLEKLQSSNPRKYTDGKIISLIEDGFIADGRLLLLANGIKAEPEREAPLNASQATYSSPPAKELIIAQTVIQDIPSKPLQPLCAESGSHVALISSTSSEIEQKGESISTELLSSIEDLQNMFDEPSFAFYQRERLHDHIEQELPFALKILQFLVDQNPPEKFKYEKLLSTLTEVLAGQVSFDSPQLNQVWKELDLVAETFYDHIPAFCQAHPQISELLKQAADLEKEKATQALKEEYTRLSEIQDQLDIITFAERENLRIPLKTPPSPTAILSRDEMNKRLGPVAGLGERFMRSYAGLSDLEPSLRENLKREAEKILRENPKIYDQLKLKSTKAIREEELEEVPHEVLQNMKTHFEQKVLLKKIENWEKNPTYIPLGDQIKILQRAVAKKIATGHDREILILINAELEDESENFVTEYGHGSTLGTHLNSLNQRIEALLSQDPTALREIYKLPSRK